MTLEIGFDMSILWMCTFGGLGAALLLVAGITLYSGYDELGWRPKELVLGGIKCFKEVKLIKVTIELMWWFGLHGFVIGLILSEGALKATGVVAIIWYVALTMGYRQFVAQKQGVRMHPRHQWKRFWALRKEIKELNEVDRKAYSAFYICSIGICLFWYWLGIFDVFSK